MSKVLVTGGTGFLGSKFVDRLVSDGSEVVLLKRSTSPTFRIKEKKHLITTIDVDKEGLETAFLGTKVDVIAHFATDYGRRGDGSSAMVETNVVMPLGLLEIGKKHRIRMFLNIDTNLPANVSSYALSKDQFEQWLRLFSRSFHCVNISLEHVFGPGSDESNFITYVIRKLLAREPHIDLTRGEQERDFVFVDDVVEAISTAFSYCCALEPGFSLFEVGSGEPVAIRKLVLDLSRSMNNTQTELRFGALPYREHELMRSCANLKAIRSLGWRARIPLEEGIALTLAYEKRKFEDQNINVEKTTGGAS